MHTYIHIYRLQYIPTIWTKKMRVLVSVSPGFPTTCYTCCEACWFEQSASEAAKKPPRAWSPVSMLKWIAPHNSVLCTYLRAHEKYAHFTPKTQPAVELAYSPSEGGLKGRSVSHLPTQFARSLRQVPRLRQARRLKSYWGSVLTEFLPSFPSQFWVSDSDKCHTLSHFVTFCHISGKNVTNLAHENIFFNLWQLLSHLAKMQ